MPQPGRPQAVRARRTFRPLQTTASRTQQQASSIAHAKTIWSAAEIAAIDDPEQAAFRIAVADFFLQRKQSELVRQGVF